MYLPILRTDQAEADLVDQFAYIGRDNPAAAERFIKAAETAFQLLAQFPGLGKSWNSSHGKLKGIRCWSIPRFSKYLVFFRPLDEGIEVLRVLPSRRNLDFILIDE